jgi:hypothetical protein
MQWTNGRCPFFLIIEYVFSPVLTLLIPPYSPRLVSRLQKHITLIDNAPDIKDGESFPLKYREPLEALWNDPGVQQAYARGNESALPENLP